MIKKQLHGQNTHYAQLLHLLFIQFYRDLIGYQNVILKFCGYCEYQKVVTPLVWISQHLCDELPCYSVQKSKVHRKITDFDDPFCGFA